MNPTRFLVLSLGNPLPKYESLHSAGHIALNRLPQILGQPAFRQEKLGRVSCRISTGDKFTLIQSPTLMNVSGGFVDQIWKQMLSTHDASNLCLTVVHDELEKDLGIVNLVQWDRSARGHNGMKDIFKRFHADQYRREGSKLARISIGIGRPAARHSATVADYVLRPITEGEREVLQDKVPLELHKSLQKLDNHWSLAADPSLGSKF